MPEAHKDQSDTESKSGRSFLSGLFDSDRPGLSAHLLFWSCLVLGTALDLWSKAAVFNWLKAENQHKYPIIEGFLQLVRTENPGAAFGIATGQKYLLVIISAAALIVILSVFISCGKRIKTFYISLGLFGAGVCGNLYDRLFNNGLVRDFIDVTYWPGKHWPAFNAADTMLCVAVGLLLLSTYLQSGRSR